MSEFAIEVEGGSSVRLPTAGKYCDRDIVVTATGGASADGVRCIQFTVTLENDSAYLPLDGLTEIPEMLSISTEWTTGNDPSPVLPNKISSGTVNILPIKKVAFNSGHCYSFDLSCIYNILRSSGIEWQVKVLFNDYMGKRDAPLGNQDVFAWTVGTAGYALDGNGTLCIKNPYYKFGAGIPYFVTAMYNVIPSTVEGYVEIDRTANTTNVTATV